jgi:hypothetical protein
MLGSNWVRLGSLDPVRLTRSSTRSPVFGGVVTLASTVGPARSASRLSRWRSMGVNPCGANGRTGDRLQLGGAIVFTRPVSRAHA